MDKEHQFKVIEKILDMLKDQAMSSKPEETCMVIMATLSAWMRANGVDPEKIVAMHFAQSQAVIFGLMGGKVGGLCQAMAHAEALRLALAKIEEAAPKDGTG